MNIHVENISEDAGAEGVSVYSLVHGMDFYYAEVRASGVELFDRDGFDKGDTLDDEHPLYEQLKQELNKYIIEENNE